MISKISAKVQKKLEEIYNDIVELENDIDKLEKNRQQVSDADTIKKKKEEVERKMRTLRDLGYLKENLESFRIKQLEKIDKAHFPLLQRITGFRNDGTSEP